MPESLLRDLDFHNIKSITVTPTRRIPRQNPGDQFNVREIQFTGHDGRVFYITLYSTGLDLIPLTLADESTHSI